jgi:hypothetical protein
MIYIKRYLDKITLAEGKQTKDIVIPIIEARGLRDEISKLLTDLHELTNDKKSDEEIIKVQITGGSFK